MLLLRSAMLGCHVLDSFTRKNSPRDVSQLDGSEVVQPCGRTTHVCVAAVEMRTLTICGGVPTWIGNDDHGPSLPSLKNSSLGLDF